MPATFRKALTEDRVVITRLDQCLAAYPPSEWRRVEDQLVTLPAFNRQVKALTRLLTSRASDCALDTQGRILLPAALRANASLGREAVVVGVLNRFEIWSPDAWDQFVRDSERLLDDVTFDVQWPVPPVSSEPPPERPLPQPKPNR